MKQIIRITNEPTFHRGVKSYVVRCDPKEKTYYVDSNEKLANKFDPETKELYDSLRFIANSFPNATVESMNI